MVKTVCEIKQGQHGYERCHAIIAAKNITLKLKITYKSNQADATQQQDIVKERIRAVNP